MPIDPLKIHRRMSGVDRSLGGMAFRALTWPLQLPYGAAIHFRNRKYDKPSAVTNVEVPVICVGNITTGGTGKTPFVEYLAKWFRSHGVRVSIVSRGYGAQGGARNDEARELELKLPDVPHVQDPDRIAAARIAIDELETQLILLDDGFQHRRIGRDLNIVLLDALEPFGFNHLLPRGLLREPLRSLNRADVIALTRADLVTKAQREAIRTTASKFAPQADWLELCHAPAHLVDSAGKATPLAAIADQRIAAFAAIGHPEAFEKTLAGLKYHVAGFRAFPDHRLYNRADVDALCQWGKSLAAQHFICTQKDLVKLETQTLGGIALHALVIEMAITAGQETFCQRLAQLADRALQADAYPIETD